MADWHLGWQNKTRRRRRNSSAGETAWGADDGQVVVSMRGQGFPGLAGCIQSDTPSISSGRLGIYIYFTESLFLFSCFSAVSTALIEPGAITLRSAKRRA